MADTLGILGLSGYSDSAFSNNVKRKLSASYVFKIASSVISFKFYC
jgi:hypothetical protein